MNFKVNAEIRTSFQNYFEYSNSFASIVPYFQLNSSISPQKNTEILKIFKNFHNEPPIWGCKWRKFQVFF